MTFRQSVNIYFFLSNNVISDLKANYVIIFIRQEITLCLLLLCSHTPHLFQQTLQPSNLRLGAVFTPRHKLTRAMQCKQSNIDLIFV